MIFKLSKLLTDGVGVGAKFLVILIDGVILVVGVTDLVILMLGVIDGVILIVEVIDGVIVGVIDVVLVGVTVLVIDEVILTVGVLVGVNAGVSHKPQSLYILDLIIILVLFYKIFI